MKIAGGVVNVKFSRVDTKTLLEVGRNFFYKRLAALNDICRITDIDGRSTFAIPIFPYLRFALLKPIL